MIIMQSGWCYGGAGNDVVLKSTMFDIETRVFFQIIKAIESDPNIIYIQVMCLLMKYNCTSSLS